MVYRSSLAGKFGYTPRDGVFVKSTKTAQVRRIGIDQTTESVILSQMYELKTHAELGFDLASDPHLFPADSGGFEPLHPDAPSKAFR